MSKKEKTAHFSDDDLGTPLQSQFAQKDRPSKFVLESVKALDEIEAAATADLFDALVKVRDSMKALIMRDFVGRDATWVNRLTLSKWGGVQAAVGEMLRSSMQAGRLAAREFIREYGEDVAEWHEYRVQRSISVIRMPRKSMQFVKEREIFIESGLKDSLTAEMKNVLMQGIRSNENIEVTVAKITKMFEPLVGDGWSPDNMEIEQPVRMQRIIRTNATDTYNQGVLTEFRDPDVVSGIKAIRYSATLDTKTTEICLFLHGRLFKPLDARLEQVLPPNHWNCRSIIEPIRDVREADKELFITDDQIKEVKAMIPTDFGGFK